VIPSSVQVIVLPPADVLTAVDQTSAMKNPLLTENGVHGIMILLTTAPEARR